MGTLRLVNISRPPWNKHLLVDTDQSGTIDTNINNRVNYVEEGFAKTLVDIAKKEHKQLVVVSALRTKGQTQPNGRPISGGNSHFDGHAVDIIGLVEPGKKWSRSADTASLAAFTAKYANGKHKVLESGAIKFASDPRNTSKGSLTVSTVTQDNVDLNNLWMKEITHFQAVDTPSKTIRQHNGTVINSALSTAGTSDSTLFTKNTHTIKGAAKVTAVVTESPTSTADGTDATVALKDVDVIEFTTDSNGSIAAGGTPVFKQFNSYSPGPSKYNKTIGIIEKLGEGPDNMLTHAIEISPSSVTFHDGTVPSNVVVGHTTSKDAAVRAPTAYLGDKAYRYVSRDKYPILDDSRSVSPTELGITNELQNKRIHNQGYGSENGFRK